MAGPQKDVVGGALLDDARRIHHVDAVGVAGHDAEIVGDHDQRDVEPARQILHQLQDLGLNGDVERGRRLIGDDELRIAGEPDRDHHALAHAAGEMMRILLEPALAVGDADQPQQLERPRACVCLAHPEMDEQRLHDLLPDRQDRIERGHRLLKDHRDIAPAHLAHLVVGETEQVASLEQDAPVRNARGVLGQQAHDRERRHRLAAAGLADDGYDLAAVDAVGNAVDGVDGAARGLEADVQVLHFEQRCASRPRATTCRTKLHATVGFEHAERLFSGLDGYSGSGGERPLGGSPGPGARSRGGSGDRLPLRCNRRRGNRYLSIAFQPSPISRRISSVCSPSRGDGRSAAAGLPPIMIGVRTPGIVPALAAALDTSIRIPR